MNTVSATVAWKNTGGDDGFGPVAKDPTWGPGAGKAPMALKPGSVGPI